MSKNYTMSKFIKRNILDTISKKFNYDPVECLPYLKETKKEIASLDSFVDDSIKLFKHQKKTQKTTIVGNETSESY